MNKFIRIGFLLLFIVAVYYYVVDYNNTLTTNRALASQQLKDARERHFKNPFKPLEEPVGDVVKHAKWQATQDVTYDPSYVIIDYPNGDVPANTGVCIDVVIRALRSIDVDLQKLIHEDIVRNKGYYKISRPDSNIDHRRCVNAIKYFKRKGKTIPITDNPADYQPGDIVFWDYGKAGHVGIVIDHKVPFTDRYYMVHNYGVGPVVDDFLFDYEITAHVRY